MRASLLRAFLLILLGLAGGASGLASDELIVIRSERSGSWSDPAIWSTGRIPPAGARVQIRAGHTVVYDLNSHEAMRAVFVAGTLRFAGDRDTCLEVGLLRIQPGEDVSEDGFNCDAHLPDPDPLQARPALEVGTTAEPLPAGFTARIRLVYFAGTDADSFPALVCCGGRMEFHGAPLNHYLGQTGRHGATRRHGHPARRSGERLARGRSRDPDRDDATEQTGENFSPECARQYANGRAADQGDRG